MENFHLLYLIKTLKIIYWQKSCVSDVLVIPDKWTQAKKYLSVLLFAVIITCSFSHNTLGVECKWVLSAS